MSQVSVPPPAAEMEVEEHKVRRWVLWGAKAITWLVLVYLVIVQIILFLGFILHLFGANPSSGFVEWAYRNLESAMRPFRGIFAPIELGTAGNDVEATLETSIIFAMIVYGIIAFAVSGLVDWFSRRLQRLDDEEARQRAWIMHQQELQAISDQAAIARAQQAAVTSAAAGAAAAAAVDATQSEPVPAAPDVPPAPAASAAPTPPAPPASSSTPPPPPPSSPT